uniref:Uncharacterized protein n=1 Tax=Panagrolaimus superbus TaxID=310955 RepID=A0A914XX40_9BILA
MSFTDSETAGVTVHKRCQQLADMFQVPAMYSLDTYEINLPYDEFHKRVMSDANIRIKLQRIRRNSPVPVSITASGYWDHLNWHNIKINNFDFALPKI